jgi:creatinine amidohydrolase
VYPFFVMPPITISCSHEHSGWRGTISISAPTQHQVVTDVADSLAASGIDWLARVSGHGGNYVLASVAQEASVHRPHIAVFPQAAEWEQARTDTGLQTTNHEDTHAGEWRPRSCSPPVRTSSGQETGRPTGRPMTGLIS